MRTNHAPYSYPSVEAFATFHRLVGCTTVNAWRLTKPITGYINGLPTFGGVLVCTNGILCYMESATGKVYLGHLEWFVPDRAGAIVEIVPSAGDAKSLDKKCCVKRSHLNVDISEFA